MLELCQGAENEESITHLAGNRRRYHILSTNAANMLLRRCSPRALGGFGALANKYKSAEPSRATTLSFPTGAE
jgi:hypothetical protein